MSSVLPVENAKPATLKNITSGPLAVAKFLIDNFSTVRQRDPPNEAKTCHIRLITISPSHYCEKARFVLDHVEAKADNPYYYTEDAHPPAFHAYETLKVTKEDVSITPMIIFEENGEQKIISQSTQILKTFMPELYPEEIRSQVEQVEAEFGSRLGATLRCAAYYHLLSKENVKKNHDAIVEICADPKKVAKIESTVFDKFLEKGLAVGIKKAIGVHEDSYHASMKALREVFAEWSERLEASGGEYLLDTKEISYGFTAADLTLAALAFPLVRPPEMEDWLVSTDKLPSEWNEISRELSATTLGKHALKVYEKHRIAGNEKRVTMKYADRSKSILPPWRTLGMASAVAVAVTLGISFSRRS